MTNKQVKSKERVQEHAEVFTAEREVKAMCDLVDSECRRVESTFLEPSCGTGNFLVEILQRKLDSITDDYTTQSLRALKSIYGVEIQKDNCQEARTNVYNIWESYIKTKVKRLSAKLKSEAKEILETNIINGNFISHMCVDEEWNDTSEPIKFKDWDTGEYVALADMIVENTNPMRDFFLLMKFNVIIGNPPYQKSDGGTETSAIPIYNRFIEISKNLSPDYITMIVPSRWFTGGKGLDDFREEMLNDKRISKIIDYISPKDCFPDVDVVGGVNIFLWDSSYNGECEIINASNSKPPISLKRNLNEFDILIRDNVGVGIIRKVLSKRTSILEDVMYPRNPFGFTSKERGHNIQSDGDIVLYSSDGESYISPEAVMKNRDLVSRHKVTITMLRSDRNPTDGKYRVISNLRVLPPDSVHTETYILMSAFDDEEQAENFRHYMSLKLPRFLMYMTSSTQNISRKNFCFVPYLDYTKRYNDDILYTLFNLTDEEREYVDGLIKPY